MNDPRRGTGRTSRLLEDAAQKAMRDISTLFVMGSLRECGHAMHMLCVMVHPERACRKTMTVHFPNAIIRFTARDGGVHRYFGWRGMVAFDHSASPGIGGRQGELARWHEWLEFAEHINRRFASETT